MFTIGRSSRFTFDGLNGSEIRIPTLEPMLAHWPMGINKDQAKLELDVDARIDLLCKGTSEELAAKMKAWDFALFASALWPQAAYDRLRIMAFFMVWISMWTGMIDDVTGLSFEGLNDADVLRKETLRYVQQCLNLSDDNPPFRPDDLIIRSFDVIGESICEVFNQSQRQRVFDEIAYFIQTSRQEQYARLKGQVLPLEEYNRLRIGTVAFPMLVALNEFVTGESLPRKILESARMKTLSDQTSLVAAYTHDILAVGKEVAQGPPSGLIPVLYAFHKNLDQATKEGTRLLEQNIKSLDSTFDKILAEASADNRRAVDALTKYCKFICTGLLHWTLQSKKYGLNTLPRDSDGSFRLHLTTSRRESPLILLGGGIMRAVAAVFHPPLFISVAVVSFIGFRRWWQG